MSIETSRREKPHNVVTTWFFSATPPDPNEARFGVPQFAVNHTANTDLYDVRDLMSRQMTKTQLKEFGEWLVELVGCMPNYPHGTCCDLWVEEDGLCYCTDCSESRRRLTGPVG